MSLEAHGSAPLGATKQPFRQLVVGAAVVAGSVLVLLAQKQRRLRRCAAASAGSTALSRGFGGPVRSEAERQQRRLKKKQQQRKKSQRNNKQAPPLLDEHGAYCFQPIGFIESCFPGCRGAPRQGALAPLTRAKLKLRPEIQPCALDGIKEWSHVWVTFVFHKNRKSGKKAGSNGMRSVKFKIEPPKHTSKVGIFATRSPHRVNPIGQTIARVTRVEGRSLELRGVDLVDGTPVLDIKPYVPAYESIPDATMAPWVSNAYDTRRLDVTFSESAVVELKDRMSVMRHFDDAHEAVEAIAQVLSLDIRDGGARSNNKRLGKALDVVGEEFCLDFDGLKLVVRVMNENGTRLQVVRVQRIDE